MDKDNFYQDKYFNELSNQITGLKNDLVTLSKDVQDIKTKVVYMYAFAAGAGTVASFIIDWIRTHFQGH